MAGSQAVSNVDYIAFYIEHIEGLKQVSKDEWKGHCPFPENHSDGADQNPSFSINANTGQYQCFACQVKGNHITFCKKKGIPIPGQKKKWVEPEAVFDYRDEHGTLLYQACRFPEKDFKQRRPDGNGKWIYQTKGIRKVPYKLPELLKTDSDVWIFIPEGEKHCDRLYSLGLIATCNVAGAEKWTSELNQYLKDRKVCILPDNDPPGQRHSQKIAHNLCLVAKEVKVLNLPELKPKGDIINWLDAGHTVEELFKLLEQTKQWEPSEDIKDKPKEKEEKLTQSQFLIAIAKEANLFHTPDNQIFATIPIDNHFENWSLQSAEFKRWLRHQFYNQEGKPPGGQAFQDALNQIESKGQFDSPKLSVFTRIAEFGEKIYLDLINENWEVIEISQSGWKIIDDPPVRFRRNKGMLPLPQPITGGSLRNLRSFINIADEKDWKLLISWLIGALRPNGPYAILVLQGEQGSAKSFASRLVRSIIDPSTAPLRTTPREERDLMIAATNSWVIAFDNISSLPIWLSDALCRISTGGGLSVRQNYTDDGEILFNVMRPVLLNGIDSIVTRHDLADRSIIINLPSISEDKRRPENDLQSEFNEALPYVLGSLCDAVSEALKNLPDTILSKLPRMADFAIWVSAAESGLPWQQGEFLEAYTGNRKEIVELALEADCVSDALRNLMSQKTEWTGTASDLHMALEIHLSEDIKKSKAWPKAANSLSNRLKRAATFLRTVGIDIDFEKREPGTGKKSIVIRKKLEKTVTDRHIVTNNKQLFENPSEKGVTIGSNEIVTGSSQIPQGSSQNTIKRDSVTICDDGVTINKKRSSQNNSFKNNEVTICDDGDDDFQPYSTKTLIEGEI
jgi:5S rRNA maturation endonuclease (ribonuclease M5)